MVKVLSVNKEHGLSIQLHPTKEQAGRLRAKAPEHYPDGNHKPEVGVALTDVSLVLGCKSLPQVLEVLRDLPGLKKFLDNDLLARLNAAPNSSADESALVKGVFSALMSLQEDLGRECVGYVHASLPGVASLRREAEVFSRLMPRYGMGDMGLLALVLMNHVTLRPGEAVFIAPNVPHAYLDGDLFECMACSDNVVRAGLTPKFKDIPTLVELIDCGAAPTAGGVSVRYVGPFSVVETPIEEFCVRMLNHGDHRATIRSEEGPGILLCVGQSLSVRGISTGKALEVADGGGVFIPANSGEYELVTSNSSVFYVTPSLT
jgi:mannose-6-phosphate isomerase